MIHKMISLFEALFSAPAIFTCISNPKKTSFPAKSTIVRNSRVAVAILARNNQQSYTMRCYRRESNGHKEFRLTNNCWVTTTGTFYITSRWISRRPSYDRKNTVYALNNAEIQLDAPVVPPNDVRDQDKSTDAQVSMQDS